MTQKKTVLKRLEQINASGRAAVLEKLAKISIHSNSISDNLQSQLTGFTAESKATVLHAGETMKELWFVRTGIVIFFIADAKNEFPHFLVEAGEFAMVPSLYDAASNQLHIMRTSVKTELIRLSAEAYQSILSQPPLKADFCEYFNSLYWNQYAIREMNKRKLGAKKLIHFFEQFPNLKGPNPKTELADRLIAAYLSMPSSSYSRAITKLEEKGHHFKSKKTKKK